MVNTQNYIFGECVLCFALAFAVMKITFIKWPSKYYDIAFVYPYNISGLPYLNTISQSISVPFVIMNAFIPFDGKKLCNLSKM